MKVEVIVEEVFYFRLVFLLLSLFLRFQAQHSPASGNNAVFGLVSRSSNYGEETVV